MRRRKVEEEGLRAVFEHWRIVTYTAERGMGGQITRTRRLDKLGLMRVQDGGAVVTKISDTGGHTICTLQRKEGDEWKDVIRARYNFDPKERRLFDAKGVLRDVQYIPVNFNKTIGRNASYGRAVKAYLMKQETAEAQPA